jgi:hypothetical protein
LAGFGDGVCRCAGVDLVVCTVLQTLSCPGTVVPSAFGPCGPARRRAGPQVGGPVQSRARDPIPAVQGGTICTDHRA